MIDHLFEAAPIGLGILDEDLRWVRVNDAMVALYRTSRQELLGRRPSELHPEPGGRAEAAAREVLESGQTLRRRIDALVVDDVHQHHGWFDVAWFAIDRGVGVAAVEITDRILAEHELAEAHRRDALMARASHLLSSALSVQETADLVARLAVPELADWCFVELVRDGEIERVAARHRDPAKEPFIKAFDEAFPLDPDSPVGSPKVIRTGEPELIGEIPEDFLVQAAQSEEHLRQLRAVGFRSVCIVPLRARGRILGDLALATDDESGRRFGPDMLDIAQELADRCALALDNASLYAQREQVAITLQEELLPPRLPSIPGIDVAARYAAAGEGNQVGGDFYDVFASDTGWQVVIGDVVGKGPAAAAVTGLARHTMRTAAAYEGAPSRLLRVLNDALLAERAGRRLASVACVRIDPAENGLDLTVSVAGHPLPLVVGIDGAVRELGRFGQLLGVEEDLEVFDVADRVGPGDLLILYTDGVIEARGPGGLFGEGHLHSLLMTLGGEAPTRVLQRVEAAVLAASGGRPVDDLAMIALRVRQIP